MSGAPGEDGGGEAGEPPSRRDTLPDAPTRPSVPSGSAAPSAPATRSTVPAFTSGLRIGVYRLETPLGRGGMGTVWRARDERLGREVALKAMAEGLLADERSRGRFEREARSLARVTHPNLVHLYEVGEHAGVPYLVMELVRGEPLSEALKARSRFPAAEARRCVRQVASALAAVHRAGVIHRDVKPANILLCGERGAVLTDFGLARSSLPSASLTVPGMVFGTPEYMSSEQARGEPLDARSDLYALGAVWYELVSGSPPFKGRSIAEILRHQVLTPPAPLRPSVALSEPEERAILRCLEKDRERRFPSADALLDEVARLEEGAASPPPLPRTAVAPAEPVSRRRWRLAAAALAPALALLALWAAAARRPAVDPARVRAWLAEPRIERFLAGFRAGRLSAADRRAVETDLARVRSALDEADRIAPRLPRSIAASRFKLLCLAARDACLLGDGEAARAALREARDAAPGPAARARAEEAIARLDGLFPPAPSRE